MKIDSLAFSRYLKVQGQFDRYTSTNAILISAQMPKATVLKDAKTWRENRVYLNQGATKVKILEPGKEYRRDDGTTATSFNVKTLYDISQTSARVKTEGMEQKGMRELLLALIEASPVPLHPVEELTSPAYYDSAKRAIFIKKGLPENVLFISATKEVAASISDIKHGEDRESCRFKSSCVAYMVSSKYGVDTSEASFEQLPESLASLEDRDFKKELNSMGDVLGEIHKDMYKSLEQKKPARSREQER
jgi:hypothetical protein